MIKVERLPHEAELQLANASAAITEAAIVIRQYMPEEEDDADPMLLYAWDKQLRKLKMANGLIGNVLDTIRNTRRFVRLQPSQHSAETL